MHWPPPPPPPPIGILWDPSILRNSKLYEIKYIKNSVPQRMTDRLTDRVKKIMLFFVLLWRLPCWKKPKRPRIRRSRWWCTPTAGSGTATWRTTRSLSITSGKPCKKAMLYIRIEFIGSWILIRNFVIPHPDPGPYKLSEFQRNLRKKVEYSMIHDHLAAYFCSAATKMSRSDSD